MAGEAVADRGTGTKTLAAMALEAVERFDGPALKYKEDGDWKELSYEDLGVAIGGVAGGLIDIGVEPGPRVAIFSDTRPEGTLADLGAGLGGAGGGAVYPTPPGGGGRDVLEDSESVLVFCEDADKLATARKASDGLGVETFVLFEGDEDGALSLSELAARGSDRESDVRERAGAVSPDDVFTLVYTSGTTGAPKGCVLTHGNFRADLDMLQSSVDLGDEVVLFIFLPLAHVLSRMAQMLTLDVGGTLAFWGRDMKKAMDEMKEIEPTHFPAVPRVFEKIYEKARSTASGAIKEKVLDKAVEVGREVRELERRGEKPGFVLQKEYELADGQVLSKIRELFGGRLEFALTGAAPVATEMLEFFDACGVLILEGYGATETSAVATVNSPRDYRFGTVGKALPGTEVRIAAHCADEGRGEILI